MEKFKEFEDKTLDDAIRAACKFFDATREKLEIELVQDAKNGIFGLVGARRALIRARLQQANSTVKNLKQKKLPKDKDLPEVSQTKVESSVANISIPIHNNKNTLKPKSNSIREIDENIGKSNDDRKPDDNRKPKISNVDKGKILTAQKDGHKPQGDQSFEFESGEVGDRFAISFHNVDKDKLVAEAKEVIEKLLIPIVGQATTEITVFDNRLDVHIDCGEFSGLIIGREGQTLAALQYLFSRILSRIMDCLIRVQFDVGDYRERQEQKLREIALSLAERVRTLGKSCSTGLMSSYHRRVIHLVLKEFSDIQTRSSGEGSLKRVIVQRKRQTKH